MARVLNQYYFKIEETLPTCDPGETIISQVTVEAGNVLKVVGCGLTFPSDPSYIMVFSFTESDINVFRDGGGNMAGGVPPAQILTTTDTEVSFDYAGVTDFTGFTLNAVKFTDDFGGTFRDEFTIPGGLVLP